MSMFEIMQALMVLLVSKFPKVRRFAADRMYFGALVVQAQLDKEGGHSYWRPDIIKVLLNILSSTTWDGNFPFDVKTGRAKLVELLKLEAPKTKAGIVKRNTPSHTLNADENASYQALVDDFARGL